MTQLLNLTQNKKSYNNAFCVPTIQSINNEWLPRQKHHPQYSYERRNPKVIGTTSLFQEFQISNKTLEILHDLSLYENGWDDSEALKPIEGNILNIKNFMLVYGQRLGKLYSQTFVEFEINPCRNGSIDLVWRGLTNFILINFRDPSQELAFFYFDEYDHNLAKQGGFKINEIDDLILSILKKLK